MGKYRHIQKLTICVDKVLAFLTCSWKWLEASNPENGQEFWEQRVIKETTNLVCKSYNFLIRNEGPRRTGQPQGGHVPPLSLSLWPQKFRASRGSKGQYTKQFLSDVRITVYSPRSFLTCLRCVSSLSQGDFNICKKCNDCLSFTIVPNEVLLSCLTPLPWAKSWDGVRKHAHWTGHPGIPGPLALNTRLHNIQKPWHFYESHI